MPTPEYHATNFVRHGTTALGMVGMAGITLLQALNHKSLVIVAETMMPLELGAAAVYGRFAVKSAQAMLDQPILGQHAPGLVAEPTPDTKMLARQIGLEG